jgi:1-acyl-sn-glycerol-3-phosphate acyltransferase
MESPKVIAHGHLVLTGSNFYFVSKVRTYIFDVLDLTCITTNGHYFEFKIRKEPFYQIHFHEESPLKYEIIFQKLLSNGYSKTGHEIIEFQPSLKFYAPSMSGIHLSVKNSQKVPFSLLQVLIEIVLILKLRILFPFFMKVKIKGKENLSKKFPFIIISNHQSILDPFIILTYLDNEIGFLTKSTSFCSFIERIFLKVGRGIPTTRYQTDPAVVRHLLKYLNHNIPVGIFPEGERCWDGQMQPFKFSVIRLLHQLRVPIIPVIIENAFQLMPRWAKFPRRQEVKLTVCPAFSIIPGNHSIEAVKEWLEDIFFGVLTNKD